MLLAIGQGNNDVVKYLIGKGTDISIQDKDQVSMDYLLHNSLGFMYQKWALRP